jgi:phosphoketolase
VLEEYFVKIRRIQRTAHERPKGWTGPKQVDGHWVEGFWRAHQVPLLAVHDNPAHFAQLERWLRSYRPVSLSIDVIDRVTRLQVSRRARQGAANEGHHRPARG